jgi:uncharacterized membrane protein YedE/YeeE
VTELFANAQPVHGLVGGVLIGLAAALMLLGAGRIAGVSGITARATGLTESGMSKSSAWAFLVGLPVGALLISLLLELPRAEFGSWPVLIIGGLAVGIGTRMGSGCTSGHGVCGVSRLSHRSLIATATFMAAGIATVALMNAMGGQS